MADTNAYRAYDLLTNEELGRYPSQIAAYDANWGKPITVIYRPSKRKPKK